MTTHGLARAAAAGIAALALATTSVASAEACPPRHQPPAHHPGHRPAPKACSSTKTLTLLGFNDFHGRLASSNPDTVAFFGTLEAERQAAGEKNTMVISSGDNVGASLFPSAVQDDNPTIDVLNAMDIQSATTGNHELDKGWEDFTGRIQQRATFPYLAANLYKKGTKTPAVKPYTIIKRDGLRIAVVGAVTDDLHSLVSPTIFDHVDVGDPVAAVNRVATQLTDGNPRNGEADVVIASYHEGSAVGAPATLTQALASKPFANIVKNTSPKVAAIFTAHTHQAYAWDAPVPGTNRTRPVIQSGSYGAWVGKVQLTVASPSASRRDDRHGWGPHHQRPTSVPATVCSYTMANVAVKPSTEDAALVAAYPRVAAVKKITDDALAKATVIGARVIATSSAPITRGLNATGSLDNRATESSMTDMVAQMFYDKLSNGNPNFIGVQNPGGTRADLPAGDISYAAAAAVLPFANTLQTTQITGDQVKTMLEQQWQTNADGSIPARPYLQLGLSKNVSYTYDESRPAGDRITSISVNGKPIEASATYTIGSGNFLIAGGDNFRVLAQGTNTRDTGASDLAAWVDWLTAQKNVAPSFARRAVSVKGAPATIAAGSSQTVTVGAPQGPLQLDSLDMASTGAVANDRLVATLGGVQVGTAEVSKGQATITVTIPAGTAKGAASLVLTASGSGTTITLPVTVS